MLQIRGEIPAGSKLPELLPELRRNVGKKTFPEIRSFNSFGNQSCSHIPDFLSVADLGDPRSLWEKDSGILSCFQKNLWDFGNHGSSESSDFPWEIPRGIRSQKKPHGIPAGIGKSLELFWDSGKSRELRHHPAAFPTSCSIKTWEFYGKTLQAAPGIPLFLGKPRRRGNSQCWDGEPIGQE